MKRFEMIDSVPVLLEHDTESDWFDEVYLNFWGGCDKVVFSSYDDEEDLSKLLDIVTEFYNISIEKKRKDAEKAASKLEEALEDL